MRLINSRFKVRDNPLYKFNDETNNGNQYKGAVIRGNSGSGKSKLLSEISFRISMLGRQIHKIDIEKSDTLGNKILLI